MRRAKSGASKREQASTEAQTQIEHARKVAAHQTRCEHEAQDLAQDAWLLSWRRAAVLLNPRAWYRTVIHNLRVNAHANAVARSDREVLNFHQRPAPTNSQRLERQELAELLHQELAQLTPRYARALELHYLEERNTREVASILGVPVETARTWVKRGRGELAERLEHRTGGRTKDLLALCGIRTRISRAGPGSAVHFPASQQAWVLGVASMVGVGFLATALLVSGSGPTNEAIVTPLSNAAVALDQGSSSGIAGRPTGTRRQPRTASDPGTGIAYTGSQPLPPTNTDGPTWRLSGQVRDARGQGIPGALIFAQVNAESVELTRTEDDGSYSASIQTDVGMIWAEAAGYLCGEASFLHDPRWGSESTRRIPLVLRRAHGRPFTGKVTSRTGEPVEGASIRLRYRVEEQTWIQETAVLQRKVSLSPRTTDARGYFTAPPLDGALWDLEVHASGYSPLRRRLQRTELADRFVALTLSPGASIQGQLFADVQVPAAEARVEVTTSLGTQRVVTADGNGAYSIDDLPEGKTFLLAQASGSKPNLNGQVRLDIQPGVRTTQDIVLAAGGDLSGRTQDHQGEPLAGWRVSARPVIEAAATANLLRDTPPIRQATTDSLGRFDLALQRGAPHWISLHHPQTGKEHGAMRVTPGSDEQPVLVARKPSALEGHLLLSSELEGAGLWIYRPSWPAAKRVDVDPTTGRFAYAELAPGLVKLLLWPQYGGPKVLGQWKLKAGRTLSVGALSSRLRKPLHVRVIDPEGEIVAHKRVSVVQEKKNGPHRAHRVIAEAKTGEDGSCVFSDLPEDPILLRLGFGKQASSLFPVSDHQAGPLTIQEPPMVEVPVEVVFDDPVRNVKRWLLTLRDSSGEVRLISQAPFVQEPGEPLRRFLALPVGEFVLTCQLGEHKSAKSISVESLDQHQDPVVVHVQKR